MLQIIRLRATRKDGTVTVVETAVPSFGPAEDLASIVVDGISRPMKMRGEWAYSDMDHQMVEELS